MLDFSRPLDHPLLEHIYDHDYMTMTDCLYVSLIYYMTIMTMTTYPNGVFRVTPMGVFGGIGVFGGTPMGVF
jgi:hypothetical protein